MAIVSAKEYREKSVTDLQQELLELRREQFNLRMQQGVGQVSKNHLFNDVRKNIARLKTIVNEKTKAGDK
ncbi:MAG: 50S ribosomal protein L29 [Gammaproteobacteria bacterium]|nr:50S ribosomal protein L29 [Gammaproteobacteria bacterium]